MSDYKRCPYCGYDKCDADFVDVGIGFIQCGPYFCDNCNASEIGSFDDLGFDRAIYWEWRKNSRIWNHETKKFENVEGYQEFILPDTATISKDEFDKGWYKPGSPLADTVNTYNGEYVKHEEALRLYKEGKLDIKGEI